MKPVDVGIVLCGVLLAFLLASIEAGFTSIFPKLTTLVILIGSGFAWLSREYYSGEIGRGLEIIATGFILYAVTWWIHKEMWHGTAEPAWLGIISPAWQMTFHLLTVILLGIIAYGFYILWSVGGETG